MKQVLLIFPLWYTVFNLPHKLAANSISCVTRIHEFYHIIVFPHFQVTKVYDH